jgi:hypothetical protein
MASASPGAADINQTSGYTSLLILYPLPRRYEMLCSILILNISFHANEYYYYKKAGVTS